MARVDLRTVAELMGPSSIRITMFYACLTPQRNRAAMDRLVFVSVTRHTGKAAKREDELVTKSVTSKNLPSEGSQKNRTKSLDNTIYNKWPRSSDG